MLVQTLMLFSTRHIFCSEIPCESDHLQCCPNMCPFREKRRTRGILINAVNVPAGGWWFHTPGLPAAVPQERCQPLWGCVCGLGDRVHSAAHRSQRGLPVPGVRPRGRAAGVEPLECPPDWPHHAGPPRMDNWSGGLQLEQPKKHSTSEWFSIMWCALLQSSYLFLWANINIQNWDRGPARPTGQPGSVRGAAEWLRLPAAGQSCVHQHKWGSICKWKRNDKPAACCYFWLDCDIWHGSCAVGTLQQRGRKLQASSNHQL